MNYGSVKEKFLNELRGLGFEVEYRESEFPSIDDFIIRNNDRFGVLSSRVLKEDIRTEDDLVAVVEHIKQRLAG